MAIDDYIGEFRVIFFDMSDPSHRYYYEILFNGVGIRRLRKSSDEGQVSDNQTILDQYIEFLLKYELIPFKWPTNKK